MPPAAAGGISRRKLAWAGMALAAIILLAVNLIASSALRDARLDLTKEGIYMISEGTRKTLRAIDEPVDIRVYFSKKLGEASPSYGKMFERVRTCSNSTAGLRAARCSSTFLDPEPFSEPRTAPSRAQGHSPQSGRRDGLFRHRRHQFHRYQSNLPFLTH